MTWFPHPLGIFKILFFLYFNALDYYVLWRIEIFVLFFNLYASLTLIFITFFRLGNFSSMIVFKIFSVLFTWISSPFFIPIFHSFEIFGVLDLLDILCQVAFRFKFLTVWSISFAFVFEIWNSLLYFIQSVDKIFFWVFFFDWLPEIEFWILFYFRFFFFLLSFYLFFCHEIYSNFILLSLHSSQLILPFLSLRSNHSVSIRKEQASHGYQSPNTT